MELSDEETAGGLAGREGLPAAALLPHAIGLDLTDPTS